MKKMELTCVVCPNGCLLSVWEENGETVYLMFFHGTGPEDERVCFDKNASVGLAWSRDLIRWEWR